MTIAMMMTEGKGTTMREESARWRTGSACISGRAPCLCNAGVSLPVGTVAVSLSAPTALGGVDELGVAGTSPGSTEAEDLAVAGGVAVSSAPVERTRARAARRLLPFPRRAFAFMGGGEAMPFASGLGAAGGAEAPSPGAFAP